MRLILASLLTTVGAVLPAQQFDTRGIPADAAIVLVTAPTTGLKINSSPAMKALRERLEKIAAKADKNSPKFDKILREEFGVDTNDTNSSFALGLNIANGANGTPDFSGAAVIRMKVDPKKVEAFGKKRGIATFTAGGKTGWNALQFFGALGDPGAQAQPDGPDSFQLGLFVVDASTIVIAQPKDAAACFASLAGKTAPYALNAAQKTFVADTGRSYGFFAVNLARLPSNPELEQTGLANAMMAFGEKGPNQVYKIAANFTTAEKAKTTGQQIQGFLAAAPLLLAIDPAEPAEQQALKKVGTELVSAIQPVKVEGNQAAMTISFETEKLIGMIAQLMDIAEKQMEAQGGAASGAPAVKATGGKKKPVGAPASK